ncbi:hypothetical protein B0H11DRAFT_2038757 [Mycena galericulata]|nr:hypothetical protein B0H11DRAFT_2038757 [Mycena galericulata]
MDTRLAFPVELEREIFETAATLHRQSIPSLLRVARRVLIWIEPLLYKVIDFDSPMVHAAHRAMRIKPASFFQDSVRHLMLSKSSLWSQEEIHAFLCPRLVSLGLPNCSFVQPTLLPVLQEMVEVRKCCVQLSSLW